MQNNLSVADAASILMGAGLVKLADSLEIGLILVGAGVLLKVLVAVLNKNGIVVSAPVAGD